MNVKMVVLDLDGTVLRTDKTISDRTLEVLGRCRKAGIRIVVATSRSGRSAEKYTRLIEPDCTVLNGGAQVVCGGKTVWSRTIPDECVRSIIAMALEEASCRSVRVKTENENVVITERAQTPDDPVYKITLDVDCGAAQRIEAANPACRMMGYTGERDVRFAHREAIKRNAVAWAAEYLGIDMKDVAAFGDDYNDIDMLEGCETGVAMGNAIEEVKRAAGFVCGTNDEDGAAEWIEEHIL